MKTSVKGTESPILLQENGQKTEYQTAAIIVHEGDVSVNGHYVLNYLNQSTRQWQKIDDNEILMLNNHKQENEKGAIYILTRKEPTRSNPPIDKGKNNAQQPNSPRKYSDVAKQQYNQKQQHENTSRNHIRDRSETMNRRPQENPTSERESIQMRKNNIIIRGIKEKSNENDIQTIINMNRAIGNENFSQYNIIKTQRIGQNFEKGRPLKVELDSYMTKVQLLRNLPYLKENNEYQNIHIQHDLTKTQMLNYQKMIQESMEKERNEPTGRYIYRVRGPPGQWEIVKMQKNIE